MNNKRLLAIADIFDNKTIIDVGSDHGYLPIYLLKIKKVSNAIIIEVNDGPIKNATKNVGKNGLRNKVQIVKSNGLNKLDTMLDGSFGIVVAGMGGTLIKTIIENDLDKFKRTKLYLQPNNNEYMLREYLTKIGFEISTDFLVKEDGIIYSIIVADFRDKKQNYTQEELFFGINIKHNELFLEKWEKERDHIKNVKYNIEKSGHKNLNLDNKLKIIIDTIGE
ncbi:MAG: tRNA (adenine(22)-N(1))-methyltransferase [Mycoplasmatales bacterium]